MEAAGHLVVLADVAEAGDSAVQDEAVDHLVDVDVAGSLVMPDGTVVADVDVGDGCDDTVAVDDGAAHSAVPVGSLGHLVDGVDCLARVPVAHPDVQDDIGTKIK